MTTAVLLVPLSALTDQSFELTWLSVVALILATIWLFRRRRVLRTSFLIPLCSAPALAAAHYRFEKGIDSAAFAAALTLFLVLCVVGLLVDAFWSPRSDDLADLEQPSRSGAE